MWKLKGECQMAVISQFDQVTRKSCFLALVLTFITRKAKGGVTGISGKELVLPFARVLGKTSGYDLSIH